MATPRWSGRFALAGRPGIYFGVVEEGEVGPGDPIERVPRTRRVTLAEVAALIYDREAEPEALRRASQVPALAASIREELEGPPGRSTAPGGDQRRPEK